MRAPGFAVLLLTTTAHAGGPMEPDDLPVPQLRDFERGLYGYLDTMNPGLVKEIEQKKTLDDKLKADLNKAITEFKERFAGDRKVAATSA